ncbi:hypothetical protein FACS1894171_2200 [Clostridia bacterium]|nr:hypothetical protein FACS1894171_2200 [Clostridia bacterium]
MRTSARVNTKVFFMSVYLGFIVLIVAIMSFVLPSLATNVMEFGKKVPEYYKSLEEYIRGIRLDPALAQYVDIGQLLDQLSISKLFSSINFNALGQTVISFVSGSVMNVASGLLSVFMGLVISIYMLLSRETIYHGCGRLLRIIMSESVNERVHDYAKRINKIFYGFIYGQLLDAVILGTLATVVLSILGAPFPPLSGVFLSMTNLVPYFGPIVGIVIVVLLIMLQQGFWAGFIALVVLIILQQIDANVIGPRVVGQSVGLRPLWIIFAISIGGGMFGFIGIVLSVPVFAAIRLFAVDLMDVFEKLRKKKSSLNPTSTSSDK